MKHDTVNFRRLVAGVELCLLCWPLVCHNRVTAADGPASLLVDATSETDLDNLTTRSDANDSGLFSTGNLADRSEHDDGEVEDQANTAKDSVALGESANALEPEKGADSERLVASSDTVYDVVFTSIDALDENGINPIHVPGEIPPHTFPNVIDSPRLTEVLGKSAVGKLDRQLAQKGNVIQGRVEVALTRYRGVESPLSQGRCDVGGAYLFVRLRRPSSTDDRTQDFSTHHLEAVDSPWEPSPLFYFPVPSDTVLIQGGRGVGENSVVLLACVRHGERPIIFPNAVRALEEAPPFTPEPFKSAVEVLQAEAFGGAETGGPAVLKLKLAYVLDGGRSASAFIFFGTLPEAGAHASAFVLGSLKRNRNCTLRRSEKLGPVVLSCSAWKAFKAQARKHARLGSAGKMVRESGWITAGILGSIAVLSAAAMYLGLKHDRDDAHYDMVLNDYRQDFSGFFLGDSAITSEVAPALADSADPRNMSGAFQQLGRRDNDHVPGSVLFRGAGVYGAAAAGLGGLLTGAGFLGEKFFRSMKRSKKAAWLQQHAKKAIDRAEMTEGETETTKETHERGILYIVAQ